MARNKRRLHENQPAIEPAPEQANEPATEPSTKHQQPSGRKTRGPTRCLSLISLPKANHSKQKICHTAGSKSFAQVWDEEEKKRTDGRDPTRSEIFIITHRPKAGKAQIAMILSSM